MATDGHPQHPGRAHSPDVVVSIVNHENRDLLRACLRSLPDACAGLDWSTTVVDNLSLDGSREMLAAEFPDVAVIANRHRMGFGANHNQVLRPLLAGGGHPDQARYVLVLNDDTTLRPHAVTRLVQMLDAHPTMAAVAPVAVDTQGRAGAARLAYPTAGNAWHTDWTDITEPADADAGYLQGCCLLLRITAVAQVGPFDERFFLFYEDVDLSRRLADAGWELGVCPEAVVVHVGHASVFKAGMAEFTPRQGRRSRYLYFRKHQGRIQAEAITGVGRVLLLTRAAKAAAGAALNRDPSRRARARRLLALARFNPRRPLPPPAAPGPEGVRTGSR